MKAPELRKQDVWQGRYRDVGFKICNWSHYDSSNSHNPWPSGNWNYYVYIPESKCPKFSEIWFPDMIKEWTAGGRKYVTHDYYQEPLGSVQMHGGITYYDKHGHVEGHRSVEIGCDYQHYQDEGQTYNELDVYSDVRDTIDCLYETGIISKQK